MKMPDIEKNIRLDLLINVFWNLDEAESCKHSLSNGENFHRNINAKGNIKIGSYF